MGNENADRSAAWYDRLAPSYDERLSAEHRDGQARQVFQRLVQKWVPPNALIMDFGCGTGIDAQWYAHQGYRVLAYDNSPGMLEQLAARCQKDIERGTISVIRAPYHSFLSGEPAFEAPVAIAANFAVLNLVDDLTALFRFFARRLPSGGLVIGSVLNPWCLADAQHRWWWRGVPELVRSGVHTISGPDPATFRHSLRTVRRAGYPHFRQVYYDALWVRLPRIMRGRPWVESWFSRFPIALRRWFSMYLVMVLRRR